MSCVGGTVEGQPDRHGRYSDPGPLRWTRYFGDGRIETGEGRVCKRLAPWTSPYTCGSCFLYRGVDRWNFRHTGLDVNDEPLVLSERERAMYEAAQEAALDDNFLPMDRFVRYMRGEAYGTNTLRRGGDEDALSEYAAYMRKYRADHPEYRKRDGELAKERMRRYRERKKLRVPPSYESQGEKSL